jgi:hypothetical protein
VRRRFDFRRSAVWRTVVRRAECNQQRDIGYAKFYSRSHHAVIRVFEEVGNVVKTEEHVGDFREPMAEAKLSGERLGC